MDYTSRLKLPRYAGTDYAGTDAPPAFVYAERSKVRVWRVAVSEG